MIIFLESIKEAFIEKLIKNVEKVIPKAQESLSIDKILDRLKEL